MAELKPIGASKAPTTKSNFINAAGDKPVKAPTARLKKLSDPTGRYAKILAFGDYGTGKTISLVAFLLRGMKILVVTTDIGGDGLSSIIAELKRINREELKENLVHVVLPTHEDVINFFKDPNMFWDAEMGAETIWDFGIDLFVWDGFTGYQQLQLAEYVEFNDEGIRNRDESIDTQRYWGAIRRETGRALNRFLGLHNRKTGQLWHKYMTCLDTATMTEQRTLEVAAKSDADDKRKAGSVKEAIGPFIQGSAGKLMGPAFDLVILMQARTKKDTDGRSQQVFTYRVSKSETFKVKSRGVNLSALLLDEKTQNLRADMGAVWDAMVRDFGLPQKQMSAAEVVTVEEAA